MYIQHIHLFLSSSPTAQRICYYAWRRYWIQSFTDVLLRFFKQLNNCQPHYIESYTAICLPQQARRFHKVNKMMKIYNYHKFTIVNNKCVCLICSLSVKDICWAPFQQSTWQMLCDFQLIYKTRRKKSSKSTPVLLCSFIQQTHNQRFDMLGQQKVFSM